jgi:S1-C subfamily serine protease
MAGASEVMMKRRLSLLLAVLLLLGSISLPAAAASYVQGQFTDVNAADWFADSVAAVCTSGWMQGDGQQFRPSGQLTIAETLALACRLRRSLSGEDALVEGSPWYQVYVDDALASGILPYAYTDYTVAATRAEFVRLLSAAIPDDTLTSINSIADGAIDDVSMSAGYAEAVYRFYRAGLLTGDSDTGSFRPAATITRAEAAAVLARILDPARRQTFTLQTAAAGTLTATQIYTQCSPSVFYLELFDADENAVATGSGFFISSDGVAVTNFHVIQKASSARITTSDGQVYNVLGVYDYDEDNDIALLQVDGSDFSWLPVYSGDLAGGATVYTLGSPLGLSSTIAEGIISNPHRTYDGVEYIQTTASISSGSSGGALIDDYGQVIGITTASLVSSAGISQNVNLAIPITRLALLSRTTLRSFSQVLTDDSAEPADFDETYRNGAPNYAYVTGQEATASYFDSEASSADGYVAGADRYLYPYSIAEAAAYMRYLLDNGYAVTASDLVDAGTLLYYEKDTDNGPCTVGVCVCTDFAGIWVYPGIALPE